MATSQKKQILNHLSKKGITPLEALHLFGCFRLSARIKDLRDEGHKIKTTMIRVGKKKMVAKYFLLKSK